MAITGIEIIQDNKDGNVDLLAIHNPLTFLIEVTHDGTPPEKIYCELKNSEGTTIGIYNPVFLMDNTSETRIFLLISDAILRSFMPELNDYSQVNSSMVYDETLTSRFTIRAYSGEVSDSVIITACHASRQFGENPAMIDVYNNTTEKIIGYANTDVYVYFYNSDNTKTLTFSIT